MYDRLSVLDNLMLFADINAVPKKNVLEILDKIGMKDTIKRKLRSFQRV